MSIEKFKTIEELQLSLYPEDNTEKLKTCLLDIILLMQNARNDSYRGNENDGYNFGDDDGCFAYDVLIRLSRLTRE